MEKDIKEITIDQFTELKKFKLVFKPEIRVQAKGEPITWLDEMTMVNKHYMVKISTADDHNFMPLDKLQPMQLVLLHNRLNHLLTVKNIAV